MRYLIVQDWENTHGNHAGMVHMCKLLCDNYPEKYRMFVKVSPKPARIIKNNYFSRALGYLNRIIDRRIFVKEYLELCQPLFKSLVEGDEIFLLEYHLPITSQLELAKYIKKKYHFVKLFGLSHLTPIAFKQKKSQIDEHDIIKWSNILDKQLTLGSSLSKYFKSIGMLDSHISTGFHYVDNEFYSAGIRAVNTPLTIISMGAQMRNYDLLSKVVHACTNVKWIICAGNKSVDDLFLDADNVTLHGFLSEEELKKQMELSDVSINIMDDTVGSNVITTSLSMGLAMIVSNVGSIHDYCDSSNAIFCENTLDSFVKAVNILSSDPQLVFDMKKSSYNKANRYTIKHIDRWFDSIC